MREMGKTRCPRIPARLALACAMVAAMATVTPSRASGLCSDIDTLIQSAREGFAGNAASLPVLRGASECEFARQPGGGIYYCVWSYRLRAAEARRAFEEMDGQLRACLGQHAQARSDPGVNHPDTYDARQYPVLGARVTVSLKDKGALQRSLVFVRVDSRPNR